MKCELTKHAELVIARRQIALSWVETVLSNPAAVEPDPVDPQLEHRLCRIPERDNRVLRVIVNKGTSPVRVVTAYFDRKMRSRL